MSKSTVTELLSGYQSETDLLLDKIVLANQAAVDKAALKTSAPVRLWNALVMLVSRSLGTFARFEKLMGAWVLICVIGGGIFAYQESQAPGGGLLIGLAILAAMALAFVALPTLLFGMVHLYSSFRDAFATHGTGVVAAGSPEIFLALSTDSASGKLTGVSISRGRIAHHSVSPIEDVTTPMVPSAYVMLYDRKRNEAMLALNAQTAGTYTWFGSAEFLRLRCVPYSEALVAEMRKQDILQHLEDLAQLTLTAKERPAAKSASKSVFAQKAKEVDTGVTSTWESLILPDEFKEELQSFVEMMKNAPVLRRQGFEPPTTLLLYGPPGTGKTQVARTLATMSGLNFMPLTASDFKGQYIGESAPKVKAVFEKARELSPCILFVDEIESVVSRRDGGMQDKDRISDEIVAEFLVQLDGVVKHDGDVFLVAATNFPEKIDSAVLSRMKMKHEIPLPDVQGRRKMLGVFLEGKPVEDGIEGAIDEVAKRTEGYAGRDLRSLVDRASQKAIARAFKLGEVDSVVVRAADFR